jgi:hypothetical protein
MESFRHNGTFVISAEATEIKRKSDKILEELDSQGIFKSRNVLRYVWNGWDDNLETLLNHGTDRTEERDFDFWIRMYALGGIIIKDADACRRCKEKNDYDDVVKVGADYDFPVFKRGPKIEQVCTHRGRRLYINCSLVNNVYATHPDCPTYMSVAGGPRVFFGSYGYDERSPQEVVRDLLHSMTTEEGNRFLLIYDENKVQPYDVETFIFKEGIKPTEALKCIVARK